MRVIFLNTRMAPSLTAKDLVGTTPSQLWDRHRRMNGLCEIHGVKAGAIMATLSWAMEIRVEYALIQSSQYWKWTSRAKCNPTILIMTDRKKASNDHKNTSIYLFMKLFLVVCNFKTPCLIMFIIKADDFNDEKKINTSSHSQRGMLGWIVEAGD